MAGPTIVILDDSELVLEMVRDCLSHAGYEVKTASNGIEANKFIYATPPPALVILDVMMPLLDGDKKLSILKTDERTRNIPFVFLSSKPAQELQKLVGATGADGYLCKPFEDQDLLDLVRKLVKSK